MTRLNDTLTERQLEVYLQAYQDEVLDQMMENAELEFLVQHYDIEDLDVIFYLKEDGTHLILDMSNDIKVEVALMKRESPIDPMPEFKIV